MKNPIKRIYCRVFQTAFRIALPLLPYRNPHILHSVKEVPKVLSDKGLKKPLLVTDASIRGLGLTEDLEKILKENGCGAVVYDQTKPNPTAGMVADAYRLYQEHHCDCIIAFGGGSPMDCAKAVGACAAYPGKSLDKMAGILKVVKKTPTLLAVPTTAGTGSETTLAAVIVDEKTRHKYVINSFPLIPSYAVLDPAVIRSLPASVAATTGMDALTHAIEAYIGRSTTRETRRDARKAVRLIFENIKPATAHESEKAEKEMLVAAHLAGRAFTRSYVGYVHAVSHSLSGRYNMPHGLTNAVLLPIVLEMYGSCVYKKLAQLAVCAGIGKDTESEEELAKRMIAAIYQMNEDLGIPKTLEGIQEKDIESLAAYADKEANPLYPVPVLWDKKQLEEVYRKVMA
ncbi:MAG: iron-containing alcohol dehydrogenase, partial [Lachnospiraceae bacterium]